MAVNSSEKLSGAGCIALLVSLPIIVTLRVVAIVKLWAWFVVPLGVVGIVWHQAFGLIMLWGLIHYRHSKTDWSDLSEKISQAVFAPLMALGIGWVLTMVAR